MSEKVTCTHVIQMGTAVTRTLSTVLDVEAYDVIEVTVNDGAADDEVKVQPGSEVRLLMIASDSYSPPLKYKVNATGNPARTLDQPQVFAGPGAIELLDASAPSSLFFSNSTGRNSVVSIVVGRMA